MKQSKGIAHLLRFLLVLFILAASFAARADDDPGARTMKCLNCCINKKLVCFNLNPDRRLCTAEQEACVKTCESEGAVSSDWRDCWSEPGGQERNDDPDKHDKSYK